MKRIYDKRPKEHRKRAHYNSKGVVKQCFENENAARKYMHRTRLLDYTPYLCPECNHWHIGKRAN